jgi:HD-like signal output (HDOD) protein
MIRAAEIARLLPTDPALLAHCRRVAALAHLIAHHLFLPSEEKSLLHAACLLHHVNRGFSAAAMSRLLADICPEAKPAGTPADPVPAPVLSALSASRRPGSGNAREQRLGEILRVCDALDQEVEAQPIEQREPSEIMKQLEAGVAEGLWSRQLMDALEVCMRPLPLGGPETWQVPTFPQAVVRILGLLQQPDVDLRHVVDAARLDPSASGTVMQLANSALFGMRHPAASLSEAISRLGFNTARRVLSSVAIRPILRNARLEGLWPHSLEVADLAEQLGVRSGTADAGEAYLAGLLHDVGRIALLAVPLYDSARLHGLRASSCPAVYAENLLLRTDHAALGADVAGLWHLPEYTVTAIRHHHTPEATDNRLAHLLYLAEYLSASDEDLPSQFRMATALRSLGMTLEQANQYFVSDVGNWLAAA